MSSAESGSQIQDQRIFISGQIGLMPSTLTLPSPQSLAMETALACQHADRVVKALQSNSGGGWNGHIQLVMYWMVNFSDLQHMKSSVQHLVRVIFRLSPCSAQLIFLQDPEALVLFLGVPSLPKDALIEKQVVVHTGRFKGTEDDEHEIRSEAPTKAEGMFAREHRVCRACLTVSPATIIGSTGTLTYTTSGFSNGTSTCAVVCVKGGLDESINLELEDALSDVIDRAVSVRLFYRPFKAIEST